MTWVNSVERYGRFKVRGDAALMGHLDRLLAVFVVQQRLRLPGQVYTPRSTSGPEGLP